MVRLPKPSFVQRDERMCTTPRGLKTGTEFVGGGAGDAMRHQADVITQPFDSFMGRALHHGKSTVAAIKRAVASWPHDAARRPALRDARDDLVEMIAISPFPVLVITGRDRRCTYANRAFDELWPNRQIVDCPIHQALPELEHNPVMAMLEGVFSTGMPTSRQECRIPIRRGQRLSEAYFNVVLQPIVRAGSTVAVCCFAVESTADVVARREVWEAAGAVVERERWLQLLLDLLPTPLVIVDSSSKSVQFHNRWADAWLKSDGAGLESILTGSPTGDGLVDEVLRVEARGEKWETVEASIPVGGERHEALISARSLPEAHGHPRAVAFAMQDVSELRRVHRELERALQLRDVFMSVAAHELRSPVSTLKLSFVAIAKALEMGSDVAPRLQRAEAQVDRLAGLITRLLDATSISQGRIDLEPEEVDLVALVAEALDALRGDGRVQLRLGGPARLVGTWDRLRLEQIVVNLVGNAIKYGGGEPVDVVLEPSGASVRIVVEDRGPGIPPEARERIFDRYERVAAHAHRPGLGLGLWITRRIVEQMGGAIRVESELGRGSRFIVDLPLSTPTEAAAREGQPAPGSTSAG